MKKLSFLLITVIFAACVAPVKETEVVTSLDVEAELAAIEDLRSAFALILKEGRYEDMGKYVTSDVITVRPGDADWDEMFALGEERGRFPYDSIIMQPSETILVNDSIAYDMGESWVYYTNEAGEQVELRDKFLAILKKQDGQWKLHREVSSSHVD